MKSPYGYVLRSHRFVTRQCLDNLQYAILQIKVKLQFFTYLKKYFFTPRISFMWGLPKHVAKLKDGFK